MPVSSLNKNGRGGAVFNNVSNLTVNGAPYRCTEEYNGWVINLDDIQGSDGKTSLKNEIKKYLEQIKQFGSDMGILRNSAQENKSTLLGFGKRIDAVTSSVNAVNELALQTSRQTKESINALKDDVTKLTEDSSRALAKSENAQKSAAYAAQTAATAKRAAEKPTQCEIIQSPSKVGNVTGFAMIPAFKESTDSAMQNKLDSLGYAVGNLNNGTGVLHTSGGSQLVYENGELNRAQSVGISDKTTGILLA
ncbi:hypothetical protein C5F63_06055 [Photobacterium damselae subsp. damselae]|uniref:hypothetical protein n=1 Tax=Photobacterium damselae TaxID=38293 RepID=UPI000D07B3D7|nr:hypothetical protein [Photobacterium damselae]PSB89071.1 hypothetical protein C5F63_06055 [Photobacterium damselae subsp. damselae]